MDIKRKAGAAHTNLRRALKKYNYVLSKFDSAEHALMANLTHTPIPPPSNGQQQEDVLKGVMNPQTTKWLPLTLPLFAVDWPIQGIV